MVCVVLWAGDIRHLHSSGEASRPISDALLASTVFTPPEFTMCNNHMDGRLGTSSDDTVAGIRI